MIIEKRNVGSRTRAAAIVVAAAMMCGCASASDPATTTPGTFPVDPLVATTSDGGKLHIEVRTAPSQPPPRGASTIELTVTDASGKPADGLALTIVPWMPAMGHGSSVTPLVTPQGGGKYLVTQVSLFMPGEWELRTSFDGAVIDHAAPSLQIP